MVGHRNRVSGFTLLELLVVISMLALLIGILMPSLARAREQSKRARCLANLHAISQGIQAYVTENRDYLPEAASLPSDKDQKDLPPIYEALADQLGGKSEVYHCPADRNIQDKDKKPYEVYFEGEGTSYEWRLELNHMKIDGKPESYVFFDEILGEDVDLPFIAREEWMMPDYEPFHGRQNNIGSKNIIFADLSVRPDKASVLGAVSP